MGLQLPAGSSTLAQRERCGRVHEPGVAPSAVRALSDSLAARGYVACRLCFPLVGSMNRLRRGGPIAVTVPIIDWTAPVALLQCLPGLTIKDGQGAGPRQLGLLVYTAGRTRVLY